MSRRSIGMVRAAARMNAVAPNASLQHCLFEIRPFVGAVTERSDEACRSEALAATVPRRPCAGAQRADPRGAGRT